MTWMLFSLHVYRRFSSLGDSAAYIEEGFDEEAQLRTRFISMLASAIVSLSRMELGSHLAFAWFSYSGITYLAAGLQLGSRRWSLLAVLLSPGFGVWSSVVGREALFIGCLGYCIGAMLRHYRTGKCRFLALGIAMVMPLIFFRSVYGASIALFCCIYVALLFPSKVHVCSALIYLISLIVACLLGVTFWEEIDEFLSNEVLPTAKSYFTINSPTTRTWIALNNARDFLTQAPMLIPLSLLGPTLAEVYVRPVMFPFMVGGCGFIVCLIYAFYCAFLGEASWFERRVMVLAWFPSVMMILLSYMPYGVYNPGSSIRYASCFVLFFFLPIVMRSYRPIADNEHK